MILAYLTIGALIGLINWRCHAPGVRVSWWEWTLCLLFWPLSLASLTLVCVVMTIDRIRFGPLRNRRL